MSKADQIFINNMRDIMENGFWDTDLNVRPHWEDGTPAHTVKKFCIVNRYNLQEELPILDKGTGRAGHSSIRSLCCR